jgi:hypothetical protein
MKMLVFIPRWRNAAVTFLALALLLTAAEAKKDKQHYGAGVSASVARPYVQVLPIVREIAEDGTIRGSSQYKGTDDLAGATAVKKAEGFPPWNGQGTVFYKVRSDVLSPTHFLDSGDKGTVVVRYIVESIDSANTRVIIDAVFNEDSHHRTHPSDGGVESMEFVAISQKFTALDAAEKQKREEAEQTEKHKKLLELQEAQSREQAQLDSVNSELQAAEQKIAEQQKGRRFRVQTAADLKAAPFNSAQRVRELSQGDAVLVLLKTPAWYKVQTRNGEQGWVYHLMLEAIP